MDWLLLIVTLGVMGDTTGAAAQLVTQEQCLAALKATERLRPAIGIVCISPDGKRYSFDGAVE